MIPVTAIFAGASLLGLGGGADAGNVKERSLLVAGLIPLAQSGNLDAWLMLGAVGKQAPLPKHVSFSIPGAGTYNDAPEGWWSTKWGSDPAYVAIQTKAAQSYAALKQQYASAGVPQAQTGGSTLTVAIPSTYAPVPAPTLATAGMVGQWPWWVIAGLVVLLLLLFVK